MATASRLTKASTTEYIPRLEPGDHLTVAEFERRYAAMPPGIKAELIEGVVYMSSPASSNHGRPHFRLVNWLGHYGAGTPVVEGSDNGTVRLELGENQPQPDACLYILHKFGGQSWIDEDNYIAGAPELAAEIAVSSVSYDLHEKLHVYEKNGIREYIVWRVEDEAIDWFVLRGGKYRPLKLSDGLYKSKVFPGLWLDPQALVQGNMARVFEIVQQGLASPEHQKFVNRLQARKK